jgi:serine/threonine-protein kinase
MTALKKSAATHVYLPTGHRLGRYEALVKLATGGMAVVYVGRAQGLAGFERLVALKVLHQNLAHEDEFVRMFLDEARLAARIRHPNVVPTIDISDTPETGYFIVMDYVEGDHFGALLSAAHKSGGSLAVPVALRIVADALSGLGAAHDLRNERGELLKLVHRDVSPHNIMVGVDGVARLTDFGVAKAEDRLAHTRDGQLKGKLAYMAPEQALRGNCDARSDLFAMGVILWEALTGRRLFRADNPGATLTKLLHEPIVLPGAIDPALEPLDAVLGRALDREPDNRYQSAEEFIDAIERVAPKVGGLASLREVSALTRQLAGEKLRKEHELLELAKEALLLQTGVVLGREDTHASQVTSGSDISMASLSLTRSKVSGVFSSATATGMQTGASLGAPPLVVPPPAGGYDPPPRASAWNARQAPLLISIVLVLAMASLLVAWLTRQSAPPIASPLADEVGVPATPTAPTAELAPPQPEVEGAHAQPMIEKPADTHRAAPPAGSSSNALRGANGGTPRTGRVPPRGARGTRGEQPAKPLKDDLLANPYHD